MSRLQLLSLSVNDLTGPIPNNRSFSIPQLQELYLDWNNFVGQLPSGLAACQYLKTLILAMNNFHSYLAGSTATSHQT